MSNEQAAWLDENNVDGFSNVDESAESVAPGQPVPVASGQGTLGTTTRSGYRVQGIRPGPTHVYPPLRRLNRVLPY